MKYLQPNKKINNFLIKNDPMFFQIVDKCIDLKIELNEDYFTALIFYIIGQQLSNKVANIICQRVLSLCNKKITPEAILEIQDEKFREAGVSYSKISYMNNLALSVKNNKLDFSLVSKMSKDELISMLTAVKGIGIWTAEMFLIFSLGREDIFSVSDVGLQRIITRIYGINKVLSRADFIEISDCWKPYRTYASLYLWELINRKIYIQGDCI